MAQKMEDVSARVVVVVAVYTRELGPWCRPWVERTLLARENKEGVSNGRKSAT